MILLGSCVFHNTLLSFCELKYFDLKPVLCFKNITDLIHSKKKKQQKQI